MRVEAELRRQLLARGYAEVMIAALSAGDVPVAVYQVTADGGPEVGLIRLHGTVAELRARIARLPRLASIARRGDANEPV